MKRTLEGLSKKQCQGQLGREKMERMKSKRSGDRVGQCHVWGNAPGGGGKIEMEVTKTEHNVTENMRRREWDVLTLQTIFLQRRRMETL